MRYCKEIVSKVGMLLGSRSGVVIVTYILPLTDNGFSLASTMATSRPYPPYPSRDMLAPSPNNRRHRRCLNFLL